MKHVDPFDDDAMRALLGTRNLERARLYHAWGAVFDTRRAGDELSARCEGSSEETYRVQVRIEAEAPWSTCSCPVGEAGGCKHVGALLLRWREAPGAFIDTPALDERLRPLHRDELLALVRAMATRHARIDDLLPPLPAAPPPGDAWRERAAALFRRDLDAAAVAEGLDALLAEPTEGADRQASRFEALAHAVLGRWRRYGVTSTPLVAVARRCLDGLAACAAALVGGTRAHALRALVGVFRFDIEQGTALGYQTSPGRHALALVARIGTVDERRELSREIYDGLERADPWPRRAWSVALLTLDEGDLDDDTWISRARSLQRNGAVARRLAVLGRVGEAMTELPAVHDAELVDVAEVIAAHGGGGALETVVAARLERASERNRERMAAWLRARAEARRDAEALVAALEAEFHARPDAASFDALREAARRAGVAAEVRALAWLDERGHPLRYDVLLRERRLDEALRMATGDVRRPTSALPQRRQLAEALEADRPRDALEVYHRAVDGAVALRSRPWYREACRMIVSSLALHARLGDAEGGVRWVAELRARHASLPAFQEELDAALTPDARAA